MKEDNFVKIRMEGKEVITASDISSRISDDFGFDLDSRAVGRRLTPLGFTKHKTGVSRQRIIRINDKKIGRLVSRYLPKDDRERWKDFKTNRPLHEFIALRLKLSKPKSQPRYYLLHDESLGEQCTLWRGGGCALMD